MHVLCVVWELIKQRLLRSFSLLVGGFEQSVFVFWFVLLFGMLLGVWGNTGCCSIESPLCIGKICLVVPFLGFIFGGCCFCGGGVLCENCIVDANAIKKQQ